jgi:hypothetical protein
MTRDIAGRLQWPAAQWATAQAELSRVLNNLSASVQRGMSLPYMKEELGSAIAALHQRFAGAAPRAPAAAPAQPASGAPAAPRPAASRQAATASPPALGPALSAQTIQSLQGMLPTQSVVKALTAAGYPPDRAPQGLTSLPAMAAQFAKLKQLQSSPQWHLLARHLGPEVNAIQASLAQANGAMTRDAGKAMSLMNAAEKRLHGGTPLSGEQSNALRATAAQLQGLQATIQNTYAALRTAGLYEADRHPVATQIATWRASLASRLDAASQPPAAGSAVPAAAVHAALQAVTQWGQAARQLVEMPAGATLERRQQVEGLVMRAGQQLQRALVHPEVIRVMKASSADGTGTASASMAGAGSALPSASPPPNGEDPRGRGELKRRLLEALINAAGSGAGDLLEHFTGGAQLSPEKFLKGQLIAASVGFIMPASLSGPVKGSLINGATSSLETYARQRSGIDPENPSAVVASFFLAASMTAGMHRMGKNVDSFDSNVAKRIYYATPWHEKALLRLGFKDVKPINWIDTEHGPKQVVRIPDLDTGKGYVGTVFSKPGSAPVIAWTPGSDATSGGVPVPGRAPKREMPHKEQYVRFFSGISGTPFFAGFYVEFCPDGALLIGMKSGAFNDTAGRIGSYSFPPAKPFSYLADPGALKALAQLVANASGRRVVVGPNIHPALKAYEGNIFTPNRY